MKLLVIGHSVFDFITKENKIINNAGGIYYTIQALRKLKQSDDEIYLCSQYDLETFKYFQSEYDNVNKDYMQKVNSIPRVHLNFTEGEERHEKYENITQSIDMDIKASEIFDGILINMITGFDISLEQLNKLRSDYNGLIFIDVHSLARGVEKDFRRNFKTIPNFEKWAECVDIIQVNQAELFTLSDKNSEIIIAKEILDLGVKILCVTKGIYGARIYFYKFGEVNSQFVSARKILNTFAIGSGDVFGATFFYSYILNKNPGDSLFKSVLNVEKFLKDHLL